MSGYRLELFRQGFMGMHEPHPLRRVQALIRARAFALEREDTERSLEAWAWFYRVEREERRRAQQ